MKLSLTALLVLIGIILNCGEISKQTNAKEEIEKTKQLSQLSTLMLLVNASNQNQAVNYCNSGNTNTLSTTNQKLLFGQISSTSSYLNFSNFTITTSQKVVFTSTTTNLSLYMIVGNIYVGNYCGTTGASKATGFTRNVISNQNVEFTTTSGGTYTFWTTGNTASQGQGPNDIYAQIQ